MSFTNKAATILAITLSFSNGFTQSLRIKGGVNFAGRKSVDMKTRQANRDLTMVVMENISVSYEQSFNELLSCTGGFTLNGRGYVRTVNINYVHGETKTTERLPFLQRYHYIDVPLTFNIRTEMGRDFYFYGYTGVYAGYAIAGKGTLATIRADATGLYIDKKMEKIDLKKSKEKRGDFGYQIGGGVEVQHFFFEAAFSAGLIDIRPAWAEEQYKTTNYAISLSVGYRFEFD